MRRCRPAGIAALNSTAIRANKRAMAQSTQLDKSGVVPGAARCCLPAGDSALASPALCFGATAPLRAFRTSSCLTAMSTAKASADAIACWLPFHAWGGNALPLSTSTTYFSTYASVHPLPGNLCHV